MKKFIKKIILVMLVLFISNCFAILKVEAKYSSSYSFKTTTAIENNNQSENDEEEAEPLISVSYSEDDGILTITVLVVEQGIDKVQVYIDDACVKTYSYNGFIKNIVIKYNIGTDFAFYENVYAVLTDTLGNTEKSNVEIPNPDKIYDSEDLIRFKNVVNNGITDFTDCTVYLMDSIDMSSCDNWEPVGNEMYFSGNFEGNYNTISNLYIQSDDDYVGLFSKLYGTVNELNVSGSISSSGNYVGAIAGVNLGAITYVRNYADISSTGSYVGGIAGYNDHGYFAYCGNEAQIESTGNFIGGITGFTTANSNAQNGVITFSYNKGAISGYEYVAGLAGAGWDTDCTDYTIAIRASYNKGDITATSGTVNNGGILGGTLYTTTGSEDENAVSLKYVYNSGNIVSSDDTINQISPQYVSDDLQLRVYYPNTSTDNSGVGEGMAKEKMTTVGAGSLCALFNNGDEGTWQVTKHGEYPIFLWENN